MGNVRVSALDHVQLAMPAGREDEATAFYEGLLGITRVPKPANLVGRGGCWFESGELKVHLGVDPNFSPATKAHPAFIVDDVAYLAAAISAAGHEVVTDEPLEGYDRVYVLDPFGNRIELMQPSRGDVRGARLLLTCGLPGAGKTVLARQLAAERGAVRLTKDEWLWALGSSPWDAATQEKLERELWRHAQELLRLGVSVVVDFGLWTRVERDEMRSVARVLGVGVELHVLDVAVDELWRRIDARNSQPPWDSAPIRRSDFDGWLQQFQVPDAAELALFDLPPRSV